LASATRSVSFACTHVASAVLSPFRMATLLKLGHQSRVMRLLVSFCRRSKCGVHTYNMQPRTSPPRLTRCSETRPIAMALIAITTWQLLTWFHEIGHSRGRSLKLESVCDSDARTCSVESLAFPFVLPFRSLDRPGWLQTTTLCVPATPAKDQLLDLVRA
jgi:hypothetical protein